jgi:hypothetical protein
MQVKVPIGAGPAGDEIQEVPLRHQHQVGTRGRQVREVGDGHRLPVDVRAQALYPLMGKAQEFVEQAKVIHHRQR